MAIINGNFLPNWFLFGTNDAGDTINGFGGNDIINQPGDGIDVIDGGTGIDTINYSGNLFNQSPAGIDVDLDAGVENDDGFGNTGTIIDVENVTGTNFDDTINGDNSDNVLNGLGGNDQLFGGNGNDTLRGGFGDDTLFGNAGSDMIFGGAGDDLIAGDEPNAFGSDNADDVLTGGFGNDTFIFHSFGGLVGFGNDRVTDFQDDGGFLGFLGVLTGEDELDIFVNGLPAGSTVVAERDGDTLNIIVDDDGDGDLTTGNQQTQGTIEFASAFIVDNIDADDLTAGSNVDFFV